MDEVDLGRATEALQRWLLSQGINAQDSVTVLQYTTFRVMQEYPDEDYNKAADLLVRAALGL